MALILLGTGLPACVQGNDAFQEFAQAQYAAQDTWVLCSQDLSPSGVDFEHGEAVVEALADADRPDAAEARRAPVMRELERVLREQNHSLGKEMLAGRVLMPDRQQTGTLRDVKAFAAQIAGQALASGDGRQGLRIKGTVALVPARVRVRARRKVVRQHGLARRCAEQLCALLQDACPKERRPLPARSQRPDAVGSGRVSRKKTAVLPALS